MKKPYLTDMKIFADIACNDYFYFKHGNLQKDFYPNIEIVVNINTGLIDVKEYVKNVALDVPKLDIEYLLRDYLDVIIWQEETKELKNI